MQEDGGQVLAAFNAMQPDICVLDVMLPNRNGFELAADIRANNTNVPIIFLTAKTQTDDVVMGFKLGANDYIRKPFSIEELIVRIENALRIQPVKTTNTTDIITLKQYQFFVNKQVLQYQTQERKLSYREAELLKYLYQKRNTLIDRRDLLNHIWGSDSFFNSRNLDVYITKLRGYLKDDASLEILTIKGVGYRFVV
jgi:DNA-binding response OmpR family regulator